MDIEALNPMQTASLEANQTYQNVLLLSATGSGKTLAFLLPALQQLDPVLRKTQVLIVVPSRELAMQIEKVFKQMGTGIKITCTYGGHKREIEENNLLEAPAVIVGTPGRLGDHIRRGNITTDTIHTLILDEYDKSLSLGFTEEVAFITQSLPAIRKRILTSATESTAIPDFIGFNDATVLNFLPETPEKELLDVKVLRSPENDKIDVLFRFLCMANGRPAIVFCNHRESVERTSGLLKERGIINEYYHGAMEQRERDSALCKFRNGTVNVLVTTDLAARGLDIPNIRFIVHYHIPATEDAYIHRNGRTARQDASGSVVLILSPQETLPAYISDTDGEVSLPETAVLPEKPKWTTLFIAAGKKDKVNKIDIVGFLSNRGQLKPEDIGLIEVKDFFAFAAVRKTKAAHTLQLIREHRIKNKKVKIEVAK